MERRPDEVGGPGLWRVGPPGCQGHDYSQWSWWMWWFDDQIMLIVTMMSRKSNLVLGCWNHLVRDSVDSPVSLEMVASLGGINDVIIDVSFALLSSSPWAYKTIYIKLHLILRRLLTLGLWEVGGCPSGGRLGSCCWEKKNWFDCQISFMIKDKDKNGEAPWKRHLHETSKPQTRVQHSETHQETSWEQWNHQHWHWYRHWHWHWIVLHWCRFDTGTGLHY